MFTVPCCWNLIIIQLIQNNDHFNISEFTFLTGVGDQTVQGRVRVQLSIGPPIVQRRSWPSVTPILPCYSGSCELWRGHSSPSPLTSSQSVKSPFPSAHSSNRPSLEKSHERLSNLFSILALFSVLHENRSVASEIRAAFASCSALVVK